MASYQDQRLQVGCWKDSLFWLENAAVRFSLCRSFLPCTIHHARGGCIFKGLEDEERDKNEDEEGQGAVDVVLTGSMAAVNVEEREAWTGRGA